MKRPAERAAKHFGWPNHNETSEISLWLPIAYHTTFQPISASAVHALARLAAKRAVTEQLRAGGVRITLVPPRVIAEKVQRYLADHSELYQEALERAQRLGLYEKRKLKLKQIMVTPDLSERNL